MTLYQLKTIVYNCAGLARLPLLASERSERAQSCSCSIEISDTYVYIYIYICMWSYVKLCMRMLGGTYCGRGLTLLLHENDGKGSSG